MEIIYKKISEITPYENNPRFNDDAVDKVAESINQFGFKVPIVIDKNNVIVTGHTRYKASKKLKLNEVPCILADDLNDEQIKAFRLADNKVTDYSFWDNKKLLEELDDLKNIDDIFTGFEESDFFEDIKILDDLDKSDNSILEKNEYGTVYCLEFKTQNKKLYNKILELINE